MRVQIDIPEDQSPTDVLAEVARLIEDDFSSGIAPRWEEVSDEDETTHVCSVEVFEREDGTYLFRDYEDAEAFADAVATRNADSGLYGASDGTDAYRLEDEPVSAGTDAARIIAAERGDAIEDMDGGWPELAEDVREGLDLGTLAARLAEIGETETDAYKALRRWSK